MKRDPSPGIPGREIMCFEIWSRPPSAGTSSGPSGHLSRARGRLSAGKAFGAGSESTLTEEDRGERIAFGGDLIRRFAPPSPCAGKASY